MEGQVSSLAKEFTWGGLEVGENYAWCFVIEQRGGRGGGVFHHIGGQRSRNKGRYLFRGIDSSRHHFKYWYFFLNFS